MNLCLVDARRLRLALACALFVAGLGATVVARANDDVAAYARQWADAADFSGAYLVERGGQVLAEGGRGPVRAGSNQPIRPDTVFWIGSISKQFAAAAVLKLQEQGRLSLSDELRRHLPELKASAVERDGDACTIEHALSHRCGLLRDAGNMWAYPDWSTREGETRLIDDVNAHEPTFTPGTQFEYSNAAYALIGVVVQRAAGVPYERFLHETFWKPLGMTHTGITPREGLTFARGTTGAVLGWVDSASWLQLDLAALPRFGAQGNIYSNVRDLARWNRALHTGQVLSAESYAELVRPRGDGYALGVASNDESYAKLLHHAGALAPLGVSNMLVFSPDTDTSAVVLTNRPLGAGHHQAFAAALVRKAVGAEDKAPERLGALALLAHSIFLLCIVLLLPYLAWRLVEAVRSPQGNRLSWWFRYHGNALALLVPFVLFRSQPMQPAALVWIVLVLGGVWTTRNAPLPLAPEARPLRPWLALAGQVLLLGLLLLFLRLPTMLWPFAVLCLLEAGLWLALRRTPALRGAAAGRA